MAIYGGPDIVEDGLICCLDAADRNSYNGSGSIWYDLTGNNNNPFSATSPVFTNDNLGCFNFDGTDDYFRFSPILNLGNTFTITGFLKLNTNNSVASIYTPHGNGSDNAVQILSNKVRLLICQYVDGPSAAITSTTTLDTSNTIWYHFAVSLNISILNLYINGLIESSANSGFTASSWSSTISYGVNYNSADIGRRGGCCGLDSQQYFKGGIAFLSFYNRPLTAPEIRQNYNATKGRFGL